MQVIRRMFPGGNTSQGLYSLHDNIISNQRNRLYILKGMPGGGKSSLMKAIAERMFDKGYSIEYHHCPSDPGSIDAVVIDGIGVAIIDGTPPHTIDPLYPGLSDRIVDLAVSIDTDKLKKEEEAIRATKLKNKYAYEKCFNYFKAANIIAEQIDKENARTLDIRGLNNQSRKVIEIIFSKLPIPKKSNGFKQRDLFSSAYTPEGFTDYTYTILKWVEDVFFIKGDMGTGKSYLLNRILEEARLRNFEMEIYHNPMFPKKIETIYIKELDSVITSNELGSKFAKEEIDLNSYISNRKTNEDDINALNLLIEGGIKNLREAKENHKALERSYRSSIDYTLIDREREKIYNEILNLIKQGQI
ncbi:MAG: ATP-binding protein [Tissierellaceae bacterium]